MRQVKRTAKPDSLKINGKKWKKELLDEISKKGYYKDVDRKYQEHYKKEDVKTALIDMYNGLCCYCESDFGGSSYENIEHYKPKSKFPELSFEWDNLHLACQRCNTNKSDKWELKGPHFIDPVEDNPDEHFDYNFCSIIAKTERGVYTIKEIDLNREALDYARLKVAGKIMKLLDAHSRIDDKIEKYNRLIEIEEYLKEGTAYLTMCRSLIKKYKSLQ